MSKKKISSRLIIAPMVISIVFALLYVLPAWRNLEYSVYDIFLHLKPAVKEDPSIVLLDIDETSIDMIGTYPWPRGLLAQGLEALTELGAGYATFDIEYLEKSPMTVDTTYLEGPLKTEFNTSFEEIGSNMNEVFQALAAQRIPLADAGEYGLALVDYIDSTNDDLYNKTSLVAIENDVYLGQAMRLFGHTFTTINMQPSAVGDEFATRIPIALERYVYSNVRLEGKIITDSESIMIPIPEISTMSSNAGFTNVSIDKDGVRRRILLADLVDDKVFLQLAMSPLMRKLGEPEIVVRDREILLKGARYPDGVRDVRIPLDSTGHMLIRWPKSEYADSFEHIGFHELLTYRASGESIASHLRILRSNQGWTLSARLCPNKRYHRGMGRLRKPPACRA
ncbi:hypothetical protein MASR2M48_30670 [Spirochaetota bacterium]